MEVDKSNKTATLFLDLSKAFDLVDHKFLLKILNRYGFRGIILSWFSSYLQKRKQLVRINATMSDPIFCSDVGVPQGSVIGPLFFIIYLNSIFKLPLNGKLVAFADDLALSYAAPLHADLKILMNTDLLVLSRWFENHKLVLSSKSKVMCFSLTSQFFLEGVGLHDINCTTRTCNDSCIQIESVSEFKYLGVTIDSKLNWKTHIATVKQSIHYALNRIFHLRKLVPQNLLTSIYYALVNSRLEYAISCWGSAYVTNLKLLITAQKKIIRVMLFKPRWEPSLPLFKSVSILPLRQLYVYKVLKLFYLRGGSTNLRSYHFTHALRASHTVVVPRARTEHVRRFTTAIAPHIYNKLPADIANNTSGLNKFLKNLRNWLLSRSGVEDLIQV